MPLFVRGPGITPGIKLDHLVGNVDLAPTFAEWAGTAMPDNVDGRSLAPLLRYDAPPPDRWRQTYPIAFRETTSALGIPAWQGVRTQKYTYVEYSTLEKELYDNIADPSQLQNIAGSADPGLLSALSGLSSTLSSCAAASCRELEDAASPP